jgi:hypothetical protein
MATRTEKYFSGLLGTATVRGAVERAAELAWASLSPVALPVDVFELARMRGIQVLEDLCGSGCPEGLLVPKKAGYTVRLRRDTAVARRRFSLAHEMGHTFFYVDGGAGPRHAIGVLDRSERAAEERICDQFASGLLMPASEMKRQLPFIPEADPSAFLQSISRLASTFWVSPFVVVSRLRSLEIPSPPCLVIYSSVRPNPKTLEQPALRVDFCSSLGDWQNRSVWKDRALNSVGLKGPVSLYDAWNSRPGPGSFSMDDQQRLSTDGHTTSRITEDVKLSLVTGGRWKNLEESCVSASRLYSWKASGGHCGTYVISVVVPAAGLAANSAARPLAVKSVG